jgi:hypothetical protein
MPITTVPNTDGTYTVLYFGKEVGWFQKGRLPSGEKCWRAMSVHGVIKHLRTRQGARDFLLGAYH